MTRQKINKFLLRFSFIFIIHFVIKIGDETFSVLPGVTFRGTVFSVFFIGFWLFIWYLAEYLNKKIQHWQRLSNHSQGFKTLQLFSFNFLFGFAASFLLNYLYREGDIMLFGNAEPWTDVTLLNPELTMSLLLFYMMVFSFDVYLHLSFKDKENQVRFEKLKHDHAIAQYLNLKSQIEPHFLFNSLSVLSSIIHTDVELASEFILRLSRMLRYVIEKNEFILVPLKDEVVFTEDYLFLLQTRFEEGIIFESALNEKTVEHAYISPATLQSLVENAVKHNKFTKEKPLKIQVINDMKSLIVINNLNKRKDFEPSTKQGLDNLVRRYSQLSPRPVEIVTTEVEFRVIVPLLTSEQYERFNI